MNKLKFLTILSKCFAYITWALSNAIHIAGKVSRKTIDQFSKTARYDVEIFHDHEQMDMKRNINHKELLKLIDSIEVFPNISLIVHKRKTTIIKFSKKTDETISSDTTKEPIEV